MSGEIERLVPSMRTSSSLAALAPALAAAQGEIEMAAKDSVNPHFKRTYADLASVVRACRPALAKHGLAVVQVITGGYLLTRLMCGDEYIESDLRLTLDDASGRTAVQALGSSITYLRRYALAAIVGVAPDEDDDGNSAGVRPPERADRTNRHQEYSEPGKREAPAQSPAQPQVSAAEVLTKIAEAQTDADLVVVWNGIPAALRKACMSSFTERRQAINGGKAA